MALTQISTQGIKDGTITGTDLATNVDLVDNQKLRLGNSQDLQIYVASSNNQNYIDAIANGITNIRADILVLARLNSDKFAKFTAGGSSELYFAGNKKFETKSDGVLVTGEIQATTLDINGSSHLDGTAVVTGNLDMPDNAKVLLGTGDDLQIYHDGTHSNIDNATNELRIESLNQIRFNTDDFRVYKGNLTEFLIRAVGDGSVELYHNGSKKFETTSGGAEIPDGSVLTVQTTSTSNGFLSFLDIGNVGYQWKFPDNNTVQFGTNHSSDKRLQLNNEDPSSYFHFSLADNGKMLFGNNDDLQIFHSASHSVIHETGTGELHLQSDVGGVRLQRGNGDTGLFYNVGGAVELYFDGSKKFETTSAGATVTGSLGIGTTSPDQTLHVHRGSAGSVSSAPSSVLTLENDATAVLQFLTPASSAAQLRFGDPSDNGAGFIQYDHSINALQFGTNGPEKMRINSDGNVFIQGGTTVVNPGFGNNSDPGNFFAHTGYAMHSRDNGTALFIARNDSTGSLVSFNYNGGGQIADITTNGSSVSYGTGSDYRLKENITTLTNAIKRLKNLKPSRFNFLTTPSITQDGFIAHEVQEVVPEAVTGVKDEVRTEDGDMGEKTGDPVMQSLDVAKLVPLLTAGLQEAISKIELLETEVAALKAG